jgi:Tol biopolymer transport system component
VAGGAALATGLLASLPAGASFVGTSNGNVAFVAVCDGQNIGQAVYSLNPNGSSPSTYACPGGAAPNSTQVTAGSIDSMPYFSSTGSTLYFASNRLGNDAIFEVPYPSTITGAPGSQTDGATQLTFPTANGASFSDYAPTVSSDGNTLAFVRCDSSGTDCNLYTQSPIVGGTPGLVTTSQLLAPPDAVSGAADRPEIDPADPTQVLYVGVDGHIHLISLTGAFAERDLSKESGVGTFADEYPDWNPTGTSIIFDSNRTGGHKVFLLNPTVTPATVTALWPSDPGTEIEPIFAPTSPTTMSYIWTKLGNGSNIVVDMGAHVGSAQTIDSLTANKTNNSQPTWQPVTSPSTGTPEVPAAVLLPGMGGVLLGGAYLVDVRRRRHDLISG